MEVFSKQIGIWVSIISIFLYSIFPSQSFFLKSQMYILRITIISAFISTRKMTLLNSNLLCIK